MATSKRNNLIVCLDVNGNQLEKVGDIHNHEFHHFVDQFKSISVVRPVVNSLNFKKLEDSDSHMLIVVLRKRKLEMRYGIVIV